VNALTVALALIGILMTAMALIAIRFPRGRQDWPLEGASTAYLLGSVATLVVLLVAVYFVTRDWIWPPAPVTIGVLAAVLLAAAAGVALLLPRGVPSP